MRRKYDKDLIDLAVVNIDRNFWCQWCDRCRKVLYAEAWLARQKLILNAVRKELQITNQFNVLYLKVKKKMQRISPVTSLSS